jgi:hypothetical protein
MSSSTASLDRSRPRGLNLAAIRLGALLVAWGRRRAARLAQREAAALRATPTTPEQLRERAAAQAEARAALDSATAYARLHIR